MSNPPTIAIADRLRASRKARALSQSALAELADLQPSAVSHFETGRRVPSVDNLRLLADALCVSADYLLGRTRKPTATGPAADAVLQQLTELSAADQARVTDIIKALATSRRRARGKNVRSSRPAYTSAAEKGTP